MTLCRDLPPSPVPTREPDFRQLLSLFCFHLRSGSHGRSWGKGRSRSIRDSGAVREASRQRRMVVSDPAVYCFARDNLPKPASAQRSKPGRTLRQRVQRDCALALVVSPAVSASCPFQLCRTVSHSLDAIMGRSACPVNGWPAPFAAPPPLSASGSRVAVPLSVTGHFIPPGLSMPAS